MASTRNIVRVGLIGCGEISQVSHISTLGFLSDYFRITYLCDASDSALEHCRNKVVGGVVPGTTKNPAELCASAEVDVVMIASSDADHADQTILALQHQKHVFLEKPAALNVRDLHRIRDAEASSSGKVMVGYMRRYAAAFTKAVELIGGMDKIIYARVRGRASSRGGGNPMRALLTCCRYYRSQLGIRRAVRHFSKEIYRFFSARLSGALRQDG